MHLSPDQPHASGSSSIILEPHADAFVRRGRQILADVIGADRQLAMAAIDQHRELNPRRSAEGADRVHRRAAGAAGKENVVDDDDGPPSSGSGSCEARTIGSSARVPDIVAMHRDIDHAGGDLRFRELPR